MSKLNSLESVNFFLSNCQRDVAKAWLARPCSMYTTAQRCSAVLAVANRDGFHIRTVGD